MFDFQEMLLELVLPHPLTSGKTFLELYYPMLQVAARKGLGQFVRRIKMVLKCVQANQDAGA